MSDQHKPIYISGKEVPVHFSPQIIITSCIVSFIGAITAVELLHRKSGHKGWVNWLYQLGISVSFGLVGIWCMHYVGNRAIILGDGRAELQLYYNPGFTTLSAFLPIIFLFFGFTLAEYRRPDQKAYWPFLISTGIFSGVAITGMHYIGNFGISNYDVVNPTGYVVGAAAIAIVASITSLTLFFYFKAQWVNSFPRRMACAAVLAGAVSGMHWLATVGTRYLLRHEVKGRSYDRNVNLIVSIICGILACAVCLVVAFLTKLRKKKIADRAQHVVLASATFDNEGRLLVTGEGLPPCRKVTKQFNQKSFDDEFNVAHPVFQWIYRVTFNWPSVIELIPGMKNHLRAVGFIKDKGRASRPSNNRALSSYEAGDIESDYSVVFREYFCVAAEELAASLDVSLPQLGVLYSDILITGSLSTDFTRRRNRDPEQGDKYPTMFGKGQLLFLVRYVDKLEASKLTASGYRFAHPKNVSEIIARAMKVPHDDIVDTIEKLRIYSRSRQSLAASSTYLACFAIRASVKAASRSWDILVPADRAGELPMVQLTSSQLKPAQYTRLSKIDGLSINQTITYLNNILPEIIDPDDKDFTEHLLGQILDLCEQVPEPFFRNAVFSATVVAAPGLSDDRDGLPPQLFAFSVIPDVHGASTKSKAVTYTPLSFFQCIQRVSPHSPDHAILAQRIHREFGAILSHKDISAFARKASRAKNTSHKRMSRLSIPSISLGTSPRDSVAGPERDCSIDNERNALSSESFSPVGRRKSLAFGGIMVSSDTKVEIFDKNGKLEMQDLGVRSEAGVASETPTHVDDLFRITSTRWRER